MVGDQSQPGDDGEPVPKRRGIQSSKPVTGEKVRYQPQPQTGEEKGGLLVDGDQPQPTKAGGEKHVDIEWDDVDDFENDTAQCDRKEDDDG